MLVFIKKIRDKRKQVYPPGGQGIGLVWAYQMFRTVATLRNLYFNSAGVRKEEKESREEGKEREKKRKEREKGKPIHVQARTAGPLKCLSYFRGSLPRSAFFLAPSAAPLAAPFVAKKCEEK